MAPLRTLAEAIQYLADTVPKGEQKDEKMLNAADPLYLHGSESVRWKRLSALAGGHRPKRVAMSPVTPPASTVGELWDLRHVTYDRTVA
jgi:hypothetical protein